MTTQWRTQQKERLFELLYRSALDLFESQGFDETNVQQICDKAQVAKGTFFNYFPSKDHV
ncbi:MAG: TetR/AcrR family transcriptional regulator, partial [Alphaproteobacteria bacterium]